VPSIGALRAPIYCAGELDDSKHFIQRHELEDIAVPTSLVFSQFGLLDGNKILTTCFDTSRDEDWESETQFVCVATDLIKERKCISAQVQWLEASCEPASHVPGIFTALCHGDCS